MRKISLIYLATLLGYAGLMGSVSSLFREIHFIPLTIFVLSFLTGLFLDRRNFTSPLLNPFLLIGLVAMGVIVSLIGLSDKNIFNRTLGILLIIISAKLISPKKGRDILQIYLLNFFMVAGSAVTRLDLDFGLLILGETFITILGLLLVYGSGEQGEMPALQVWRLTWWSGLITLCLIPATVIVFLITPRPTMTLLAWGKGAVSRTGFSDRVTPGSVEEIKVDNSPAFRVRWIGGGRPENPLWRGVVYDRYNLGAWEKADHKEIPFPPSTGKRADYEVILEPTDSRYLISLGLPGAVWAKGLKTGILSGYTIESERPIDHRTIYRVQSYLTVALPADSPPGLFLQVPRDVREGIHSLITGLTRPTDLETARAVEAFLRDNYRYDLLPGEPTGDPVIHFLTSSKKGHCEYFASAMVFLLRVMGIPARLVGGYLGGEWNDLGRHYLVRQSDAHTWVEAWIHGKGWVAFDPTPASPLQGRTRGRIYRFIDMLRLRWYYWVVDYNIGRQLELVRKSSDFFKSIRDVRIRSNPIENLPPIRYLLAFALIPVLTALILFIRRYLGSRPRTHGERFLWLLRRHGYEKKRGETLLELGARVASDRPGLERAVFSFVDRYYLFEYGRKGSDEVLSGLLKDLEEELKKSDKK